jgi:uroporphyrinogen decarboxylase
VAPLNDRIRSTGVPVINYSPAFTPYPDQVDTCGPDVAAVNWRTGLGRVMASLRQPRAVQGNLDPMALFGTAENLKERIRAVLAEVEGHSGHVFNLGHGIHKDTPIESVEVLVSTVREETSR